MIDIDIKRPGLEVRIALANISKVKVNKDQSITVIDAPLANWEYSSVGMFGKMIADLSSDDKEALDKYTDAEINEFGAKVKVFLGNPITG